MLASLLATNVYAVDKTGTFASKATVAGTCVVAITSVGFGGYDPTINSVSMATGTIKFTCSNKLAYSLGVDRTNTTDFYFNGSTSPLAFSSAASAPALINTATPPTAGSFAATSKLAMIYNLYTDAARTRVWTGFTNHWVGTNNFITGAGSGLEETVTIYGSLDKSQYVKPGNYAATMTLTAKF